MGANAEHYREGVDAWNARDAERFLEFVDPAVEFRSRLTDVEGVAYHGHEGMRQYFADLAETFGDIRLELVDIEERGDWVVARCRLTGRGTASGASLEWDVFQASRYRAGLVVETFSERSKEDVLSAAGLG